MNKLICALFLLFSTSVFATPVVTDSVVPQNLHVYSGNGDLYVDLVAAGCSSTRYVLANNHIKYDTIVSILLAAQLSGKPVKARFDGCNSLNQGNLIRIFLP